MGGQGGNGELADYTKGEGQTLWQDNTMSNILQIRYLVNHWEVPKPETKAFHLLTIIIPQITLSGEHLSYKIQP